MKKKKETKKKGVSEPTKVTILDVRRRLHVDLDKTQIPDEVARVVAARMDEAARQLFAETFSEGFTAVNACGGIGGLPATFYYTAQPQGARTTEGEKLCDDVQCWLDDLEAEREV